jgi:hypothetical protein
VTRPPSLPALPSSHPPARWRRLLTAGVGIAVVAAGGFLVHRSLASPSVLFAPRFPTTTTLVTNEFATYNPRSPKARRSPTWIATSGSLFARDGAGWTGVPDNGQPGPSSSPTTGSAVFRVVSRRADFGNVSIRMRLRVDRLLARSDENWDGVHLFARYQSPVLLYVVSLARRDGSVVIKKKVPGKSANGGTYVQLGPTAYFGSEIGLWHDVRLDVSNTDGGVRLKLELDGRPALDTVDRGVDGPPITEPGRIGLRGDNCEFDFGDLSVRGL